MKEFWIVNIEYNRIYKCYKINKEQYKIDITYNIYFKDMNVENIFAYTYDCIGNGKSNTVLCDTRSKVFNSRKEVEDYILLAKL
jgi:hypothetical protein